MHVSVPTEAPVALELCGEVAWITLNRPAVLNALDLALVRELDAAVAAVEADAGSRVLVIRGAGRSFCSGLDLNMMGREGFPPDFYDTQERALRRLELMDKLTIAALHGHCLGGGVQLAIACDLRVASSDARLGLPAVWEGLLPGMAPYRLPRLVGLGHARRLIVTGEAIDAQEAQRIGLVDYVVDAGELEPGLDDVVRRQLEAPHSATIASKRLLRDGLELPFDEALQRSRELLAECLTSPEVAAAREAWRRRRPDAGR